MTRGKLYKRNNMEKTLKEWADYYNTGRPTFCSRVSRHGFDEACRISEMSTDEYAEWYRSTRAIKSDADMIGPELNDKDFERKNTINAMLLRGFSDEEIIVKLRLT